MIIVVDKRQRTIEGMAVGNGHLIKVFYWRLLRDSKVTINEAAIIMDEMFLYTWRYVVGEYNS